MKNLRSCAFALAVVLSAGCRQDDVEVYRISKVAPAGANASASSAIPEQSPLQWTLPKGWEERAPSQMRVASFAAPAKGGSADVSVVVLAADAGGDLANINRWRGQIGLGPISAGARPENSKRIVAAGRSMLLVDFASADGKSRLVAASYPRGASTWFFKMTGPNAVVRAVKPSFLKFLESLRFSDGSAN